jgi:hypothetical protein
MGIIKDIIREAVIRNNGWVQFIKKIDAIDPNILIKHKIIGNVIQYNLSDYYYGNDCIDYTLIKKIRDIFDIDKYSSYIQDRIIYCEDKITEVRYLWFKMDEEFQSNLIGSGHYKYAHPTKDGNIRKVLYNKDRDGSYRENELVRLSELYPNLFVRTVKTKTGYIQDKVNIIPKKFIMYLNDPLSYTNLHRYNFNREEEDYIMKLKNDYKKLKIDVDNALEESRSFLSGEDDVKYENVGYDKDGKLKVLDI